MDQYNSLPRQKLIESDQLSHMVDVHRKGVAFGKGKTSLITLKSEKSYSAPNLGDGNFLLLRLYYVDDSKKSVKPLEKKFSPIFQFKIYFQRKIPLNFSSGLMNFRRDNLLHRKKKNGLHV